MRLGCVELDPQGFAVSALFSLAQDLLARDLCCVGLVDAPVAPDGNCHRCERPVLLLPDRAPHLIAQPLGRYARGCRIDPGALKDRVAEIAMRLRRGADLVVLNKFGKQEAQGRGFHSLIAEALNMRTPVIVRLNPINGRPFADFACGLAVKLPPRRDTLTR